MARATCIYVVERLAGEWELLAAFTVKHELQTWLSKYDGTDQLSVTRLVDNPRRDSKPPCDITGQMVFPNV